jgi:hypothetical protein
MTWNLAPPPGFQGLRDDLPLECYQRHLPHWRQAGATYFLTFRLADSLPQAKLDELKVLRLEWERKHPPPRTDAQWDELWRQSYLQTGPVWEDESYDRIIRDEEHLWRTIQYIGNNPSRANLTSMDCPIWIQPRWETLGWKFVGQV